MSRPVALTLGAFTFLTAMGLAMWAEAGPSIFAAIAEAGMILCM